MGSKHPGDSEWMKTHRTEIMAGVQFWEKKSNLDLNVSREGITIYCVNMFQ